MRNLRIVKKHGGYADDGRGDRTIPKDVKTMMSESEREILVAFVGANPEAGELIPETGGVRKMRWALSGRGKRGGARVIYYYHSERLPLFLLAAYGKSEKANLTMAERNGMKRMIPALVAGYPQKERSPQ